MSAGIQEDGVFNGWTSPFDPEAVAYYTASPTETATSDFRNLSMSVTGELFQAHNLQLVMKVLISLTKPF